VERLFPGDTHDHLDVFTREGKKGHLGKKRSCGARWSRRPTAQSADSTWIAALVPRGVFRRIANIPRHQQGTPVKEDLYRLPVTHVDQRHRRKLKVNELMTTQLPSIRRCSPPPAEGGSAVLPGDVRDNANRSSRTGEGRMRIGNGGALGREHPASHERDSNRIEITEGIAAR